MSLTTDTTNVLSPAGTDDDKDTVTITITSPAEVTATGSAPAQSPRDNATVDIAPDVDTSSTTKTTAVTQKSKWAPARGQLQRQAAEEILKKLLSFHPFTETSYQRLVERTEVEKVKTEKRESKSQEAHLVDGELVFGTGEETEKEVIEVNPDLHEGNVLLDKYGIFPNGYLGKPLEEIDKGIKEKTFVIVARRLGKKYIYRFSANRSFFIFPSWNPVRSLTLYLASNQFFDYFIIATILVNCVFLAMPTLSFIEMSEYVFLGIYGVEMIVKVVARGFFIDKYTYLRDPWNWLDFIVILTALITIVIEQVDSTVSVGNLQGMRTFRVLRALKTVSILPGLKTIVNALLRAFRMLLEVIILTLFCLMIFALIALQVYKGVLRNKCVQNIDNDTYNQVEVYSEFYAAWVRNSSNWQLDDSGDFQICGNVTGSGACQVNYTCLEDVGENPNYGYTGYDNFGWAMLNSFQLLTLDYWEDNYQKVMRANGPWNVIFFLIVIFFGSFYLLNLMLAVVAMSYEEEALSAGKEKEKEKLANTKKKANPIYDLTMLALKTKRMSSKNRSEVTGEDNSSGVDSKRGKNNNSSDSEKPRLADSLPSQGSPTKTDPATSGGDRDEKPSEDILARNQRTTIARSRWRKVLVHQDSRETLRSPEDAETTSDISVADKGRTKQADTASTSGTMGSHVTFKDDASVSEYKERKNPLVKQDSQGTVSSSGVILEKEGTPSAASDEYLVSKKKRKSAVIVREEDLKGDLANQNGRLVDRNCGACSKYCACFVPWVRLQNRVHALISDPFFDLGITLCIILNTVFLALQYHGMSSSLENAQRFANYVFTAVFILEAVLKITALTKGYFYVGWNIFDLIVVLASIIDLSVENIKGLSVLRTFRLLRVVKLAQAWPTMRMLLTIIISTLGALANLTGILGIVIYIFAVIGLQLFREDYGNFDFSDTEGVRWHFQDFFHSFMMIFRVLCGEWIQPLWQCMRSSGELCMVVFLPALVLGNFIVLNLFLALLLNAFATDSIKKHTESNQELSKIKLAFEKIKKLCCCCCKRINKNAVNPDNEQSSKSSGADREDDREESEENKTKVNNLKTPADGANNKVGVIPGKGLGTSKLNGSLSKVKPGAFKSAVKRVQLSSFYQSPKSTGSSGGFATQFDRISKDSKKDSSDNDVDDLKLGDTADTVYEPKIPPSCFPGWMRNRIRWLDSFNANKHGQRWTAFRGLLMKIVDHKWFEWVVLAIIFGSSLTLAFEDVYLYADKRKQMALYILNIIFCVLFGIEMLMKWVASGITNYFKNFWTLLDFCIVVISVASLIGESLGVSNIAAFRSLRTLRALRPLRAISRWQGMKIVVNSLMRAIPAIFNVFLVGMVFWLIFSIMGVQFFAGKFYKCVNSTSGEMFTADVVPNKTACQALGQSWVNSNINFDNAGSGFLALFQVATFEGWMEVMADAVDSTDVDLQPSFENNLYIYLYFVVFIIFGSFFTLNLFIGVIIDNFQTLKKKYDGHYLDAFLSPNQRNYYNTLRKLANKKPQKTIRRPKNKFQRFFYDISVNTKFELGIVILIFLNMIVMAVEHYHQTDAVRESLDMMNIIFTTVFTLEAILKLVGLRWHYFRVAWNVFDFIIVILSILGIVLADILSKIYVTPTLLRVVRVFRIGRVLRLIKAAKGIRKLLFALIISLPAIFNIAALLFLVIYIYAIIGMSSFGDVRPMGNLNDIVNFQTFGNSFLLLLRLATSAGWNDVLDNLMLSPPDCNSTYKTLPDGTQVASSNGDCGLTWLAIPYMVSYIVIVFLIVINMYIAVILENFNQAHQQEEVGITEDDFDMFYNVWERYDPHATQFIKYEQLSNLVADLEPPLQLPKPNEIALVSFNLPIVDGDRLHCLDVLRALVTHVLQDVEETEELRKLKQQMEEKFSAVFPTRESMAVKSTTMQRKKEEVAARTLQRAWRHHKTQKVLKDITKLAMRQNSLRRSSGASEGTRMSGIQQLGRRLSNALSHFFGVSRPSSAVRRASIISAGSVGSKPHVRALSKQGKLSNFLQVPRLEPLHAMNLDKSLQDLEL
ncbi:sodium channel protein 1 brain-like isoform X2 [Pomacea canaliculata]|uniref:sodium channel protein 1 brain-like isoform X2 n=1 Tax=Pomacea canaliculata TaxID=400727 RepID=UPI000D73C67A|nr:sodium channel protein 1 brain-like isoform X2 [Pomacea canaliculata]